MIGVLEDPGIEFLEIIGLRPKSSFLKARCPIQQLSSWKPSVLFNLQFTEQPTNLWLH